MVVREHPLAVEGGGHRYVPPLRQFEQRGRPAGPDRAVPGHQVDRLVGLLVDPAESDLGGQHVSDVFGPVERIDKPDVLLPGMPKTYSTPSARRQSTMSSAVVRVTSATGRNV